MDIFIFSVFEKKGIKFGLLTSTMLNIDVARWVGREDVV